MFTYDNIDKELVLKNYSYVLVGHGQFASFVHIS